MIDQARSLFDNSDLYIAACLESIAGNVDKALDLLQQSIERGDGDPEWAKQDPDLEWIRDDPRFWEIVGKS